MAVTTRLTWNEEKSLQKLLGSVSLTLLYKSSVHGCCISDMLDSCRNQGSTVTVIYCPEDIVGIFILGHYPIMSEKFGKSNSSFYFSLKNNENEIKTAFLNTTLTITQRELTACHPDFEDVFSLIPNKSSVYLHSLLVNELGVKYGSSEYLECEVFRVEGIKGGNGYISRITGAAQRRHELLAELRTYKPSEDLVSEIRILLLGPVGSGKSSFFNSVKSVFQGHVTRQAAVGFDSTSITELFRIYSVKDGKDGESLPFKLCDSMGLDEKEGAGLSLVDICHILKGCIANRYHFNPQQPITSRHPCFIVSPSLQDRIHCVAYVLDSSSISTLSSKMVEKLKQVQKEVLNCGIQQVALLTNVTNYQEVLEDDFLNMKKSVTSASKIKEVQKMLHIPTSNILMVENYASELELDPLKDILILSALRQILRATDDSLEDLPLEETGHWDSLTMELGLQPTYSCTPRCLSPTQLTKTDTRCSRLQVRNASKTSSRGCRNGDLGGLRSLAFTSCWPRHPSSQSNYSQLQPLHRSYNRLRESLLSAIRTYKPYRDLIHRIRILLLGPVGAGKSSFFNSIKSVFRGRVTHQALVDSNRTGKSEQYRTYSIKDVKDGNILPFVLCDSMGLNEKKGLCLDDIFYILKGHIPDRYQFNFMKPITPGCGNYIDFPALKDRIHCAAFVLDANSIEHLSDEMVAKIKRARREMINCGVVYLALLTCVDSMDLIVRGDLIDIYRCMPVKLKIQQVHRKLGFAISDILVVSNYTSEWELDPVKDVLNLSALRQMLLAADEFLEDLPLEETVIKERQLPSVQKKN